MHSMRGGDNANAMIYVALDTLAKPCNALFFMTSGALLLPIKTDGKTFLKRRMGKIIIPCLVWTIIYNLSKVAWGDRSISDMFAILVYVPFSSGAYGILWFVYILIGLYLLVPILSPWLISVSKNSVKCLLGLWVVTLVLIIARNFISFPDDERQMLYYFGGYGGYFLLGYYFHQYRPRHSVLLLLILIICPFAIALLLRTPSFLDVDRWSVLGYLSLFTALCAYGWFGLIQKLVFPRTIENANDGQKLLLKGIITRVSNLSFGVYLSHIIVCNAIWRIPFVTSHGCVLELILTILLTFSISLGIVWLISLLPFAQYIIGYKQR